MSGCDISLPALSTPCDCSYVAPKVKYVVLVNKHAKRFFLQNLKDGRMDKIQKQIDRGTVKFIPR